MSEWGNKILQTSSPQAGAEQEGLNSGIVYPELLQILFVQSCLTPSCSAFSLLPRLGGEKMSLKLGFSFTPGTWRLNSQQERNVQPLPKGLNDQ